MPDLITLKDITKTYRVGEVDIPALRGVTATIPKGEFVAIMGHSGSGKTTLMNIIGCLDQPTSGEYIMEGDKSISKLSRDELAGIRNRHIGFVFQSFNLLKGVSAVENVQLPLFYGNSLTSRQKRQKAMELLERVGLGHRAHHKPTQLSGGEQQRVAIARALVNNPLLILADEPTGNLDPKSGARVQELILELNRERGLTSVIVTHNLALARVLDRQITLLDGKTVILQGE